MTELRKKELWGFSIVSFAYLLSLLYILLDNPFHLDEAAYYHPRYPITPYAPVIHLFTSLICVLVIGVVYFYFLPKVIKEVITSRFFVIIIPAVLIILAACTFYHFVAFSAYGPHEYYPRRRLFSLAFKEGLTVTFIISFIFGLYVLVRYLLTSLYERVSAGSKIKQELLERTLMVSIGSVLAVIVLLFFQQYIHRVWRFALIFLVPQYIILFILGINYVYPAFSKEKSLRKLFLRIIIITLVITLPFYGLFNETAVIRDGETSVTFFLIFAAGIPLFWFFLRIYYNDIVRKFGAMDALQLQVDTKTANIDFLRSQINPHFLFNALNTLYGLSLTEKAERTAEGIQKLGDMMRFVLTENQQQTVSIDKEVNYISHFIDLQKLRTQASDKIVITFKKYSHDCNHSIAPMLLIPLIENAFKHGISLTQPSWITIHLTCDEKKVYLDVYNSVHQKTEGDTEKYSSGIGLKNVQQRLSLLYPNKHELQIRNTPHEYIVHLTIEP